MCVIVCCFFLLSLISSKSDSRDIDNRLLNGTSVIYSFVFILLRIQKMTFIIVVCLSVLFFMITLFFYMGTTDKISKRLVKASLKFYLL